MVEAKSLRRLQTHKKPKYRFKLCLCGYNTLYITVIYVRKTNTYEQKLHVTCASFGEECRPYVGELPGLAALGGLGAAAGPAAVLGTDTLRRRARLWVTRTHVYT